MQGAGKVRKPEVQRIQCGQKCGLTCKVRVQGDVRRRYGSALVYCGLAVEEGVVMSTVAG